MSQTTAIMWRGQARHEVRNPYRKSYTLRIPWEDPIYAVSHISTPCDKNFLLLGWCKEGANREDEVEGAEEQSFEPGRFSVQADERVEAGHQAE